MNKLDKIIKKYATILNTLRKNSEVKTTNDSYPYRIDIKNTNEFLKDLKSVRDDQQKIAEDLAEAIKNS